MNQPPYINARTRRRAAERAEHKMRRELDRLILAAYNAGRLKAGRGNLATADSINEKVCAGTIDRVPVLCIARGWVHILATRAARLLESAIQTARARFLPEPPQPRPARACALALTHQA